MTVDEMYYRNTGKLDAARGISARARKTMYDLFIREFKPDNSTTILDVGVTEEAGAEVNMLEQQYPWPQNITCAGLGDGVGFETAFPGVSYAKIVPGEVLPFANKQFDIFCSNATLEHVGFEADRAFFLSEACRVAKSCFITIPNSWFPIEHHTAIPLLHWSPDAFRAFTKKGRFSHWSEAKILQFLSKGQLQREWKEKQSLKIRQTGLYLGPFSSNLALIVR